MVWKERKKAIHGSRWKYPVLALFLVVFLVLVNLLVLSATVDPVIPVLLIVVILLLIPVAIFVLDLYFCEV